MEMIIRGSSGMAVAVGGREHQAKSNIGIRRFCFDNCGDKRKLFCNQRLPLNKLILNTLAYSCGDRTTGGTQCKAFYISFYTGPLILLSFPFIFFIIMNFSRNKNFKL